MPGPKISRRFIATTATTARCSKATATRRGMNPHKNSAARSRNRNPATWVISGTYILSEQKGA